MPNIYMLYVCMQCVFLWNRVLCCVVVFCRMCLCVCCFGESVCCYFVRCHFFSGNFSFVISLASFMIIYIIGNMLKKFLICVHRRHGRLYRVTFFVVVVVYIFHFNCPRSKCVRDAFAAFTTCLIVYVKNVH